MIGLFMLLFAVLLAVAIALNFFVKNNIGADVSDLREGYIKSTSYSDKISYVYTWEYRGDWYNVAIDIPKTSAEKMKALPRSRQSDYSYYLNPSLHNFSRADIMPLEALGFQLISISAKQKFSKEETADFILSFVQVIRAAEDTDNLQKFPLETLYDAGGDCEDTAILAAHLLNSAGFKTTIVEFENHVGVGAAVTTPGSSFIFGKEVYSYGETTGKGFIFGEMPEEYADMLPTLYATSPDAYVDLSWDLQKIAPKLNSVDMSRYKVNITMINYAAINLNVSLNVTLDYLSPYHLDVSNTSTILLANKSANILQLSLPFDAGQNHRILIMAKDTADLPHFNSIREETNWLAD